MQATAVPGVPPEPEQRPWWLAKRVLLGALLIALVSGGGTAAIALNEVSKVVEALGQSHPVKLAPHLLAAASRGAPQTLLLVGNDQRPAPKSNPNGFVIPHSNEMLLVRIDPSKPTISMMSIPRELQVTIYPKNAAPVTTRINAAYGIGGAELMTETIKRVLGVSINHVFVLTFPKFRKAVNELGCVYMGVDRRYYHVNEPGGEQYFEINLQPGYQRLCGREALEFVANRHEDTSLVRDARDQRFLLEAKAQYGNSLFAEREKFERILGRTVETDLHGSGAVLDLIELLIESAGRPVRQVPFRVNLLATFDTASEQQIHESVHNFLAGTARVGRQHLAPPSSSRHSSRHGHARPAAAGLVPTTESELAKARSAAPSLPFPLEYPRARDTFAGTLPDTLRLYDIRDQRGHLHPIYTIVVDRGGLGEFYDVQGTNWGDPPLLANPGQTVQAGPRTYELFYAGEHVRAVAWREGGGVYWIENTLTNDVSPRTMLEIAERTVPVVHSRNSIYPPSNGTLPAHLNLSARAKGQGGAFEDVGSALAALSLVLLAGLLVRLWQQRAVLRQLREQIASALALEASQRPLLATAAARAGALVTAPVPAPLASPLAASPAAATQAGRVAAAPGAAPGAGPVAPLAPQAGAAAPATPPTPATGQPAATATPPARPAAPLSSRSSRHRARRRPRLAALAALALAAVAAALLVWQLSGGSSTRRLTASELPVSVFNATHVPGAAHRAASLLSAGHIRVGRIGDISTSLSPGAYVLYPPGARAEANRVAALLPGPPRVEPIQPQVQESVGRGHELVVVLD